VISEQFARHVGVVDRARVAGISSEFFTGHLHRVVNNSATLLACRVSQVITVTIFTTTWPLVRVAIFSPFHPDIWQSGELIVRRCLKCIACRRLRRFWGGE